MEETSSYSIPSQSQKETEEERVDRLQLLLRRAMRLKLGIKPGKCQYVEGWGWL
jgi:hypothetical protein